MTQQEAIAAVKAGTLPQCEPKAGAYILFPYSGTALRIVKIGYSGRGKSRKIEYIEAARKVHLGFESRERYTAIDSKSGEFAIIKGNYIVDTPIEL